ERLAEIARVMQPTRDRREKPERRGHVLRSLLEDRAPLVLREGPPRLRLLDGNERRARRLGPAEPRLPRAQRVDLSTRDVSMVADDAPQRPGDVLVRFSRRDVAFVQRDALDT